MISKIVPRAPDVRFRVDPAYASPEKMARRMGLSLDRFDACRNALYARGFPLPDETTGMYDLEAVDRWRKSQRPDLFPELTITPVTLENPPARMSMGERFAEAERRRRNG